jgi:predicted site-specific integrase-resolvase
MRQITHDMDIKSVAEYFGVSTNTIYNWKRVGRLPDPYKRCGRQNIWHGESIRKAEALMIKKAENNLRK